MLNTWRSPTEQASWVEHNRYMTDWQECDWYKYNPINDHTKSMNYSQYYEGRKSGKLPAPSTAEVLNDLYHPIHVQQEDGI